MRRPSDADDSARPPVIGVIGGVGSGKSTVAREFALHNSATVIDADQIGHQVLALTHIKQQLTDRFGPDIQDDLGDINRRALATLVFGTEESHRRNLHALESIVHPAIGQEIDNQITVAMNQSPPIDAVIVDAALLLETGWKDLCDAVVFIDTPEETRRQRVIENRSWTAEQFADREASQLSIAEKRSQSDFIIENSTTPQAAARQLADLIESRMTNDE